MVEYETTATSAIIPARTAKSYETGSWRSHRPVLDKEQCVNCMTCWVFCPDNSIVVENGEVLGFKLTHCKGCGICAQDCPKKAITMVPEGRQ